MISLRSYSVMFQETFGKSLLSVNISDIANDLRRSDFLKDKSMSTYCRYVRVLKRFLRVPGLLDKMATDNGDPVPVEEGDAIEDPEENKNTQVMVTDEVTDTEGVDVQKNVTLMV